MSFMTMNEDDDSNIIINQQIAKNLDSDNQSIID